MNVCPYCDAAGKVIHLWDRSFKSATEHDFRCGACGHHWTETSFRHEELPDA